MAHGIKVVNQGDYPGPSVWASVTTKVEEVAEASVSECGGVASPAIAGFEGGGREAVARNMAAITKEGSSVLPLLTDGSPRSWTGSQLLHHTCNPRVWFPDWTVTNRFHQYKLAFNFKKAQMLRGKKMLSNKIINSTTRIL